MLGETSYFGGDSMMRPTHYVSPHWVNSYVKRDGTVVRGHWRDGDGNPFVDRSFGYFARNPMGSSVRSPKRRTYTVNGLTFKVGPSALETGLATLLWGTVGAAFVVLQVDAIREDMEKKKAVRRLNGKL